MTVHHHNLLIEQASPRLRQAQACQLSCLSRQFNQSKATQHVQELLISAGGNITSTNWWHPVN